MTEVCGDSLDNNCDSITDDTGTGSSTYYFDADNDGYGDPSTAFVSCGGEGLSKDNTDCNDNDATIHPSAVEVCADTKDNNCDGTVDETPTWYPDADGDTYGHDYGSSALDALKSISDCAQPTDFVASTTDCDDSNSAIHPNADEYCDGVDNDCDGNTYESTSKDALV